MATPVNPAYQLDAFQEFERHLPPTWFRQLHQRQGPLYPVVWALCGAIAGARESIDSARSMAIPQTSEGFWLSLHLLGLGLTRRSAESDAQARTRYRFEFSQSRNTRQGLQLSLTNFSGLSANELRLETAFSKSRYGELTLVVDTTDPWFDIDWWWLEDLFTKWVANGINYKASITAQGLETVALPPWDYYTRFPTSTDLLAPFWQRPAFINELRLIDTDLLLEQLVGVSLGTYSLPASADALDLPVSADSYDLPVTITAIALTPTAISSSPFSRNVLGFICRTNWNNHSLRLAELWRNLAYTQQPGQPFFYVGEDNDCSYLVVDTITLPTPPFVGDTADELLGYGPWRLALGNSQASATVITNPIATLPLAGQWWTDGDVEQRSPVPIIEAGVRYLMLEFLLPKTSTGTTIRQLELLLGYDQTSYDVVLDWSLPSSADEWLVSLENQWFLTAGEDNDALTPNLPSRSSIHYRTVNLTVPPDVNTAFLLLLEYSP